jgi:Tfp pilus assembly protein PilF
MRRLSILLLMAGLAGCGSQQATSGSPTGEAANLRIADAALASGTPAVALQALGGILASQPANTDALLRQARAYVMLGNTLSAESSYRRALAANDRLAEARIGLAKCVLGSNPAQAEQLFSDALARDRKNAALLNNIGIARDLQGQHERAQEAYRRALEIVPDLASARTNLGLSLSISGRPEEGAAMLGQLAGNGGSDRRTRDNFAVALALSGRSGEAGRVLQEELSAADTNRALAGFRALGDQPPP